MMRYLTILALLLVLLNGCATKEKYAETLNTFVGSDEAKLVGAWGAPDSTYETGTQKFLTYQRHRVVTDPGTPPTTRTTSIGGVPYTSTTPGRTGYTLNFDCKTTFVVDRASGTIEKWSFQGNDCVAR
ncbi:hypothetical protein dsx2_2435 [Desulfovibrio sp. X2]|uniref:hypothetical protein n=1 Tax=Desulfovibrio sp. X2 TaxID=941449 RepID=UPI0003589593|nr:hypothetical protein [Desulfovibrio sp. X2]EPR43391.1 hypothetical protein dsx2_2435 [Desulfovibrio sp. X2]